SPLRWSSWRHSRRSRQRPRRPRRRSLCRSRSSGCWHDDYCCCCCCCCCCCYCCCCNRCFSWLLRRRQCWRWLWKWWVPSWWRTAFMTIQLCSRNYYWSFLSFPQVNNNN
ncbi:hypothetical protein ACHAXS_010821, partial [Conticribra weissflogii]